VKELYLSFLVQQHSRLTCLWISTGTDCPGKWWSHHPWRYLKDM